MVNTIRLKRNISKVVTYLFLSLIAITFLFPFFWMLGTSLKEQYRVFDIPMQWLPNPVTFSGYQRLFDQLPYLRYFLNTSLICVVVVTGQIMFSSMAAYAFARLRFPGRNKLFMAYLGTMMIPMQVTLIPLYVIMRVLGWTNTYLALIIPPMLGGAFSTFFFRQFMLTIPNELEDAARIDGAGYFRTFTSIILPLIKPALATIAVFTFIGQWNDFLWPLVVINSDNLRTLTVGIAQASRGYYSSDYPLMMAGALVSVLPVLIVFLAAEKQYVEGITMSGLKG